jgi:hypothetical protein
MHHLHTERLFHTTEVDGNSGTPRFAAGTHGERDTHQVAEKTTINSEESRTGDALPRRETTGTVASFWVSGGNGASVGDLIRLMGLAP